MFWESPQQTSLESAGHTPGPFSVSRPGLLAAKPLPSCFGKPALFWACSCHLGHLTGGAHGMLTLSWTLHRCCLRLPWGKGLPNPGSAVPVVVEGASGHLQSQIFLRNHSGLHTSESCGTALSADSAWKLPMGGAPCGVTAP